MGGLPQHAPPPTRAAASHHLSDWNVSASCVKGLVHAAASGVVDGLTPQEVLDILRLPGVLECVARAICEAVRVRRAFCLLLFG